MSSPLALSTRFGFQKCRKIETLGRKFCFKGILKVKLGGDIGVAAGPVGRNSQAATDELAKVEFLTYSRSRGLFAGVDLTGDVVNQNGEDTRKFYGKDIPYREILSGAVPTPASAQHFVRTVNEMFRIGRAREGK